jgi:hypothetical protein
LNRLSSLGSPLTRGGTCVTGTEKDSQMVEALEWDQNLCNMFKRLTQIYGSPLANVASEFREIWPVFKASDIRGRGLAAQSIGRKRHEVVQMYLSNEIRHEPECYQWHLSLQEDIPLDWTHTLALLYRVRNNLFHGEKGMHLEMDRLVVSRALPVLIHFIKGAGILH